MPLTINEQIDCIGDTISSAQWHFDVWEALAEAQAQPESVAVLNNYLEFFRATETANFESYIISCYKLFETRKDTVSFNQLKRELESTSNFDVDSDSDAARIQSQLKPVWLKICKIRNQSIGHLTIKRSIADVYAEVDLKPQQIREFINETKSLINNITKRLNLPHEAFNIRGKDSVNNVLANLREKL